MPKSFCDAYSVLLDEVSLKTTDLFVATHRMADLAGVARPADRAEFADLQKHSAGLLDACQQARKQLAAHRKVTAANAAVLGSSR